MAETSNLKPVAEHDISAALADCSAILSESLRALILIGEWWRRSA
jgi:hypothetical protein